MEEEQRNLNPNFILAWLPASLTRDNGEKSNDIASHETSHIYSSGLHSQQIEIECFWTTLQKI